MESIFAFNNVRRQAVEWIQLRVWCSYLRLLEELPKCVFKTNKYTKKRVHKR